VQLYPFPAWPLIFNVRFARKCAKLPLITQID
jgi:hypothetical protein